MYTVTFGNLVKENGRWNIDGMRASEEHEFDTLEDARAQFDAYDVRDDYETEWSCAAVKPKRRGFYAEIARVDDEWVESIDWKQWTADDHKGHLSSE